MILDFDLEGTEGEQFITATAQGNHVLDSGTAAGRDWGSGDDVNAYVRVKQAFNNLTSLQIDVIASDASDGTGNPVVLSTITVLLAALTANSLQRMPPLKPGVKRRFLVWKFTVTGTAPTTGSVIAGLRSEDAAPQNGVNYL